MIAATEKVVLTRTVQIASIEEACRFFHRFNTEDSDKLRASLGCRNHEEFMAVAYAAAVKLLGYAAQNVSATTLDALSVPLVPDSKPEPTWTDSKGETTRLRDMPTRYLRNIKGFAWGMVHSTSQGPGTGLYQAVLKELAKRTD